MAILKGRIISGTGVAGKILEDYLPVFKDRFKANFFPGTLNLKLEKEWEIPKKADYIGGFTKQDGTKRGGVWFVKGKIKNLPVLIIRPELTRHPKDIIEVIAPINIKKQYGLKDGDFLEVYL